MSGLLVGLMLAELVPKVVTDDKRLAISDAASDHFPN